MSKLLNHIYAQARKERKDAALDAALKSPAYLRDIMALRMYGPSAVNDAVSTGQIFIQSQLNKADTRLHMPLEGHTWFRDIPLTNGGGWVDTETAEFVSVHSPNTDGTSTGANDIGIVNFNRSQDVYPTFGWQRSIRISLIDSLKLAQANKSPNDILDKAVRTDWNKTLDRRVYTGSNSGKPGLVNQTIVTAQAAPNGTQSTPSPSWTTKNPIDLYNDFNYSAKTIWAASGYDISAIPDRFGVPATAYDRLLQPMGVVNGTFYAQNVLEYIKANYYGKTLNGKTPEIYPIPNWLETAGAGNSRRLIAYKFDDDCLNFGILQEIQRMGGPLSLQDGAFVATYIGNTGIVKVLRPTTVLYLDQI
jgi:hypothetical protein